MNFMQGNCFDFSATLFRKFGFPIIFLYGVRYASQEGEQDEEVCIHTLVMLPDGLMIDFEGIQSGSPQDILNQYCENNESYDYTEIIYCDSETDFKEYVKTCGSKLNESAIELSNEIIKTEKRFEFLKKYQLKY